MDRTLSSRVGRHLRGNVVAYVALFCALGLGTAYALERNSVKSKHVKDESLKGKDLRESTLEQVPDAARLDGIQSSDFIREGDGAGGHLGGTFPNPQVVTLPNGIVTPAALGAIPTVRVSASGGTATPSGVTHTIGMGQERYDVGGMHDAVNAHRLTAPVTGTYAISANITWSTSDTDGIRELRIRKNGSVAIARVAQAGGPTPVQSVTTLARLNAGEYVELEVFQDSGSVLGVSDIEEQSPEFAATFIAP